MKSLPRISLLIFILGVSSFVEAAVKLTENKDEKTITVAIDEQEFSKYLMSADLPKPFLFPVRGADGTVLTRPIQSKGKGQGDHPHHKGVWVAIDEVGGVKFWAEDGRIVTRSAEILVAEGNPAQFKVVNDWLGKDGQAVVRETTTISVFAHRLLAYDIHFTAGGDRPVEFGDTKEGLFGIRIAESMREKVGGIVTNADGGKGTIQCWGQTSDWVDYVGPVDGKSFGVAIFDHPLNRRASRYHVRDYGLFTVSPFGSHAYSNGKRPVEPFSLLPGSKLRLRYALYIHNGDAEQGHVSEVYRDYLKSGS